MADERISADEWDIKKRCPVCEDIKNKNINLEGEQLFDDDAKTRPMFCPDPSCGHTDIRIFHEVGAVELGRTSDRGDAQPWTHQMVVRCMSCKWKHVSATQPCLGNPWDETMGFDRPLDQTKEMKHAIEWSNEQAVGLRDYDEKYTKKSKLRSKRYKHTRNLRIDEAATGEREVKFIPTKKEREMRKRSDTEKSKKKNLKGE